MEVVALTGLTAAFLLGLVPADSLFAGFADPAVITVVEILLIVQVLARAALLDRLARRIVSARFGERATIATLCLIAAAISVFMNNIGALALMLPVVYGVCNTTGIAPARALMPVSIATLLGGICSEIGTPANLIASSQLIAETGHGFALFDFAWAGIPAALAGLAAIVLFVPRRLPVAASGDAPDDNNRTVVMTAIVPENSALAGRALPELPFTVHSVLRKEKQVFLAAPRAALHPGDSVLLQGTERDIGALLRAGDIKPPSGTLPALPSARAVVMPESTVVGSRVGNLAAFASRGVGIVAVSPRAARIEGTFADLQLSIGDVLYLQGPADRIADALAASEMLELGTPEPQQQPASGFGLFVFVAGIALAATSLVPPSIAFGAVVLVLAATGALDLRAGLRALNWPILIMLAAMIPLGTAVETTGAARVLAGALIAAEPGNGPIVLTAAMLVLAVLVTPFVNNATTMIVLGPIAIEAARRSGVAPEPLLIAVAMGASIDFLTPFGHHNNTLVMGLGSYRFGDFPRAGWSVTLVTATAGLLFIALAWLR
jgi:di/tricarboxylate transporter